jgi:hypothetical protein
LKIPSFCPFLEREKLSGGCFQTKRLLSMGDRKNFFTHRLAASAGERVRTKILLVVP